MKLSLGTGRNVRLADHFLPSTNKFYIERQSVSYCV